MRERPSPNGANGRDAAGRFAPGNAGGPGNPHAARVAAFRSAMLDAVTPAELAAVLRTMLRLALAGDVAAAKLVLERAAGRPELPLVLDGLADAALVKHVLIADADALL